MFDSGLVTLCELTSTTTNGKMPVEALEETATVFYGERTVSYTRMYEARGADTQIDKVIRVPFDIDVVTNMYAVFENGEQFRIDAVSKVIVKVSDRAKELSLIRLEENYEISAGET